MNTGPLSTAIISNVYRYHVQLHSQCHCESHRFCMTLDKKRSEAVLSFTVHAAAAKATMMSRDQHQPVTLATHDNKAGSPTQQSDMLDLEAISADAPVNSFLNVRNLEQSPRFERAVAAGSKNQTRKRKHDFVTEGDRSNRHEFNSLMDAPSESDIGATSPFLNFSSQQNAGVENSEEDDNYGSKNKLISDPDNDLNKESETEEEVETPITVPTSIADNETTRKSHAPACPYDLVRIALLRFRELYGNTCIKRGFIIPDGSSEWPEETWGIRLDLVRSSSMAKLTSETCSLLQRY